MPTSSKSTPTTQTTTQTLSPEQSKILGLAMPGLSSFAESNPDASKIIPPFSGVAGFDPTQVAGQEQVLGAVPGQAGVVESGAQGNQFLTSGAALDPTTNPALQKTIDASVRPIWQGLTEQALPQIRNQAVAADQFGSSRQGIAEGIATRGAETAAGDTAAKVATPAYLAGLDAMTKGVGLAPATAQGLAIPGVTTSGVGDVRQALTQAQLGEQTQRFNMAALWPLLMGKEYAGIAGAIPGGGATTTASGPQAPSGLSQALGYGAMGASALSSLLPFI